ncbi:MAG: AAA family ATPase [Rhodothalassiaceae bacterium]
MRLKTFTAKTMKDVMAHVREAMGPDAIIVSVDRGGRGSTVRVTAAIDGEVREVPARAPDPAPSPALAPATDRTRAFDIAELKAAMGWHGLPYDLADRIIATAAAFEAASVTDALAHAFETLITFSPLGLTAPRPVMLLGPPGAGKTLSIAKLAAEARMNGRSTRILTTDTVKSGGVQQLAHYAGLLELESVTVQTPEALADTLKGGKAADLTLIDSFGINPFAMADLEQMLHFLKAADAEPLLVLPAGIDPSEAADLAEIFAEMGARRFLATRLDGARRYAGILTAARAGRLALAGTGKSPYLAEPIETPGALMLARMFALPAQKHPHRAKERTY